MSGIRRLKTSFLLPLDWEDQKDLENNLETALSITEGRTSKQPAPSRNLFFQFYKLNLKF